MDADLRETVRERANNRCEYCLRRQIDSPLAPLQIEHIVPKKHGGTDQSENLALACGECNLHKGSNLTGIDPQTNLVTRLFNPRNDLWETHFKVRGTEILGLTDVGRTTVRVLNLNSPERRRVRLATSAG